MSDARNGPSLRLDLIIATLALLASASASIATVVQTRVVANQLSAAVWPYLSFTTSVSPTELDVTLDNDGLGPALIRTVSLRVDGRARSRWRDALSAFVPSGAARTSKSRHERFSVAGFGAGSNLAPRIALEAQRRIALSVCYCSILQKCWRVDRADVGAPLEVGSCGAPTVPLEY